MKTRKKILTIVGARPQFIKAAAVSRALRQQETMSELLLHTGQHYDQNMSDIFFTDMEIPTPKYNLGVKSLLQGEMTGKMISGIEEVILSEKPDVVLLYGDTNSTLAGALAAVKMHVKIVHVEAGLRSFNNAMPEEVNRILTDRVSSLLCCPTDYAVANLENEGYATFDSVYLNTGDVMEDAAKYYSEISEEKSTITKDLAPGKFVLCTLHRAENTSDPRRMAEIVEALNEIHKSISVILPMHPRTKKVIEAIGLKLNINIVPPQGYFDMLELLKKCRLVLTDSGGLQKEAYFFKKPCVTMRDETEWKELIDLGCNRLAGANKMEILSAFSEMMSLDFNFKNDIYGGGRAAVAIVAAIDKYL